MRFALTEEQLALQEATRGYLRELPGPETMAEAGDDYPEGVWSRVVEEQGWSAILVPEAFDGWGYGAVEMAVVFEEVGRRQVPLPLFGTVGLAVSALTSLDGVGCGDVLRRIAEGGTATVALGEGRLDEHGRLSGVWQRVVDAHCAQVVVVQVGETWYAVEASAFEIERLGVLDTTRPLCTLKARGAEVGEPLGRAPVERVMRRSAVMLAAEQLGGADFMLATAVEYAKVRRQYGRPIGSFQAISHMCADLLLEVESARSAVHYAAWAVDHGADDAVRAVHTAKALASEAFMACAAQSIQIHGGIGFTWEHLCHLYFKRARSGLSMLGSPDAHREAVASSLLDDDPVEEGHGS